jgi:RND family efflux transporter MFP subunit
MLVVACLLAIAAFRRYEYTPWTRDGRVDAYVVDSAAEINGLVVDVPVHDNQLIAKGDVLYRIDPRDYQVAVDHAQAALDSAKAKLAWEQASLERRQRIQPGDVPAEELQLYAANAQTAAADLEMARANLRKAQLDLNRCEVRSTVNGWVTNLTVRTGNYAIVGQRQMSVIDADSYWLTAYLEETRLQHVQVGAQADAVLMGYPDIVLLGHVESINRGIDDTNTAPNPQGLPQVSPIFTWVRLAQRIPVRIHLDRIPDGVHLAVGETCTIQIAQGRS